MRRSADMKDRLFVGRLGRAVGLKGEVEVAVTSDAPHRFDAGSHLHAGDRTLTIRTSRMQGERRVVSFEGISDRDGAEALRGAELFIDSDDARDLASDEYWDHDLIGCVVVTTDGRTVGEVSDVLHTPANEVLIVGDHLIPLVKDIVRDVKPRERIEIEALPGLLDD